MKKNLYAIAYVLTAMIVLTSAAYYILVIQSDMLKGLDEAPRYIEISARQEALGEQITKAALGMGYSENARNFQIFQTELGRILPEWNKRHEALINGSSELGISAPAPIGEYPQLQEDLKFYYTEMKTNAENLIGIGYTTSIRDPSYIALRGSIEQLVQNIRKYKVATGKITDYFVEQAGVTKTGFSLIEKVVVGVFLGILLIQGFFVFRPMVKLAGDNYLSANKAFQKVKKSEEQLKISFAKQKHINKQLVVSRKELEGKNKKLQDSEAKLLKSTEEQIAINERLIGAQEELKLALQKLQESEEEIRELADKQLIDNEKLFLAEKKLKELLKIEQDSKEELNRAITSLKGAQSQLVHSEKMASLGQLTAGIAHEINNPINFISSGMNSIKMSIESMKEIVEVYSGLEDGADPKELIEEITELKEDIEFDELMEELDELINDVNYGVVRTIEIVKGLRVFSRLDEEEAKMASINENIDATLVLLKNKTKNRIKVSKYYDEKMKEIECYPGQLNQVFMNILNNSIQAIPEDHSDPEITIYTEEEKDQVVIRLKDNGVGIPDELKNRIWEPFFTTKEVGVGTGLGMSITFGIIEKHNGHVDLISEVGKGTEFVITLPKVMSQKASAKTEALAQGKNS
ncbi:MAG: GHKL domain-containing protein [Cyclobacteriaceae bacterium]